MVDFDFISVTREVFFVVRVVWCVLQVPHPWEQPLLNLLETTIDCERGSSDQIRECKQIEAHFHSVFFSQKR